MEKMPVRPRASVLLNLRGLESGCKVKSAGQAERRGALDDIWYSEDPAVAGSDGACTARCSSPTARRLWKCRDCWRWVCERLDGAGDAPDVGELARDVGVHPRHLMRTFRRYHGCSVGEYLRRARIRRAQSLPTESSLVLAAVASDARFYDQSHFAKLFRRATGLAPSEYRRLAARRFGVR
jgi:AraC-like DNA-binding protein